MAGQGRQRLAAAAILLVALAVRLAAGAWWQSRLPDGVRFGFGDSESYWALGQALVRGQPYQYGAENRIFRTPGYPAVLAGLFWILGNDDPPVWYGRAVSAVCGTLAVGGVMWLARQWFDGATALAAGCVAAVHPEAVALGTFVLSEAPFCPLMVAQLIGWQAAYRASGAGAAQRVVAGYSLAAGVAAGLATLMRPSWLLFTPFALACGWLLGCQRMRHVRVGLPMLLALAVVMTPWWWRNYRVTGHFVPTTLQVGASLYDGLSPTATGASDMRFVAAAIAQQRAADAASMLPLSGTFEERLDRRLRDASVTWAREHPRDIARLMVVKFLRMWNVWPNAGEMGGWVVRIVIACAYVPVMLGAASTLVRRKVPAWSMALAVLPAVYLTSLHVIFVSSIRYRQPALLPLIALAAACAVGLGRHRGGVADDQV